MLDAFSFALPPFDRLTPGQRDRLRASLDLALFPQGTVIMRGAEATECLYVVFRGLVQERQGGEPIAIYGPRDCFDSKALFGTTEANTFFAVEDTLCHLVPRHTLASLAQENPPFGDFYTQDIAERLRNLAQQTANREMAALTMARVSRAPLHPPVFVDASTSVRYAAVLMKTHRTTSVLVRDGDRVGILTGTDMREAVILGGRPTDSPVGPLARYNVISLNVDDPLFDALVAMTKHSVRRVVVRDGERIVGVLEQLDLMGFLSNHSQVIALRVDRASSAEDLRRASIDMLDLVRTLHGTGVKTRFIAELVTELNRKIFRKLYELLAPPELVANSCLLVMGSEGRAEQILKTDQDNALILRDGFVFPALEQVCAAFTRQLMDFGYPACPGNIMVSNPEWARPLRSYCDSLYEWIHRPDEVSLMKLAIFYDAAAVAGDASLLASARQHLFERLSDNSMFFSHFARPTLSFDTPSGFLTTLFAERGSRQQLDIKKAAIFPLVHGIRSLSLERRLGSKTNTLDRLWALSDARVIDRAFATELASALSILQTLRLKARLESPMGRLSEIDNFVRPDELSRSERDQLREVLSQVKQFKEFITYHFHLTMF